MFAFSHHRFIHRFLDIGDSLCAVITNEAVIAVIDLGILLNGSDIISFTELNFSSLNVTCSRLNKVQFSLQRIGCRREITYRLYLLEKVHNDRLFDLT